MWGDDVELGNMVLEVKAGAPEATVAYHDIKKSEAPL